MPGALMQLVAYGLQDVYLTGNPQITYFKVVYKRHTNFACEPVVNSFTGTANFGGQLQANILRNGDLVTKMYIKVKLSGYDTMDDKKKWAWVGQLGHALIKNVELIIGGTVIDKHYGDWFNINHEFFRNFAQDRGYQNMVGNTFDMTHMNRSHDPTMLYIPLQFFFNRVNGLALPMIALQYHEVRLRIEFNNLSSLVSKTSNISDGDLANNLKMEFADLMVEYIFLDIEERKIFAQNPHEYLIEQVQFTGEESVTQTSHSTRLNFNHPIKALYWGLKQSKFTTDNATFLAFNAHNPDDTILTATRRFILRCAQYGNAACTILVADADNRVLPINSLSGSVLALFNSIDARYLNVNSVDLDNITVFGSMLNDEKVSTITSTLFSNVDFTVSNSPNWWAIGNVGNVLKNQDGHFNLDIVVKQFDNYSLNLNKTVNPVLNGKLQLNGYDRFDEKDGNYFNYVQPWQHHTNTPSDGLNMYSFALKPELHQPSGSANFSRIDNATLKLTFSPSVSQGDNKLYIFAFNYNVLRVTAGMAGLAYAN